MVFGKGYKKFSAGVHAEAVKSINSAAEDRESSSFTYS